MLRAGRVEGVREGNCGPASDRSARRRWRRKVVSGIKKDFQNRIDMLDSGRMVNEGERAQRRSVLKG